MAIPDAPQVRRVTAYFARTLQDMVVLDIPGFAERLIENDSLAKALFSEIECDVKGALVCIRWRGGARSMDWQGAWLQGGNELMIDRMSAIFEEALMKIIKTYTKYLSDSVDLKSS